MMIKKFLIFGFSICATNVFAFESAKVSGYARAFIYNYPIANATVTVLENGKKYRTNADGTFGPFDYPIGKPITLIFKKWGYKTTQSGTHIVPKEGLLAARQITFQIPTLDIFYLFAFLIHAKFDPEQCHVTTTVLANGKTLDHDKQGEAGATITLSPAVNATPFYFDIFNSGPLKHKTNPFTLGLAKTTEDGGVGFVNLPVRDKPYVISASKDGITFTKAQFYCRKDAFINISPPNGPMAIYNKLA